MLNSQSGAMVPSQHASVLISSKGGRDTFSPMTEGRFRGNNQNKQLYASTIQTSHINMHMAKQFIVNDEY